MNHIDLFSGIGGFALAAHWAGFQTEVFCERDEFCQKVLHKHWPAAPIVDDIFRFDGTRHAGATLLTGGFPCQPYSCAGKRMGNEDDRALWPEMRRVIAEAKPHWVVAENVLGIVDMALDGVLSDLEEEGYEVGTLVIPACAVNAPHRRDRVWIVAYSKINRMERPKREIWKPGIGGFTQGRMDAIGEGEVMANPHSARLEGRDVEELRERSDESPVGPTGPSISNTNSPPKNRPAIARRQCRRGQLEPGLGGMAHGLPGRMDGHFDEEPNIPRIATGIPDRAARLRALGNSIVPQVAYQIISNISKLEKSP
ncbi:MAG: DNA (cytosine-5-)-methyltransferase [Candidatus Competibacteraceae bacterium]|nr:DNA (cytosine-5-)-methyltransferase [Candidatus Competibacteraceae bacterium]